MLGMNRAEPAARVASHQRISCHSFLLKCFLLPRGLCHCPLPGPFTDISHLGPHNPQYGKHLASGLRKVPGEHFLGPWHRGISTRLFVNVKGNCAAQSVPLEASEPTGRVCCDPLSSAWKKGLENSFWQVHVKVPFSNAAKPLPSAKARSQFWPLHSLLCLSEPTCPSSSHSLLPTTFPQHPPS